MPPERKGQISLAEFGGPFFWDRLSRQIQNAEVRDEESFSEEIGVHRLDGTSAVLLMRVKVSPRESDTPLYYASFVDVSEMKSNPEVFGSFSENDLGLSGENLKYDIKAIYEKKNAVVDKLVSSK